MIIYNRVQGFSDKKRGSGQLIFWHAKKTLSTTKIKNSKLVKSKKNVPSLLTAPAVPPPTPLLIDPDTVTVQFLKSSGNDKLIKNINTYFF